MHNDVQVPYRQQELAPTGAGAIIHARGGWQRVPVADTELAPTGAGAIIHARGWVAGSFTMEYYGKEDIIKITEEDALKLLGERLRHLREKTDFFDTLFRSIGGYVAVSPRL